MAVGVEAGATPDTTHAVDKRIKVKDMFLTHNDSMRYERG